MLHLFTYFILVLPSISSLDNDCWSYGACLQSVMIDQVPSEDPLSCEKFCQAKPDCSWFTYYEDHGVCVALTECVKVQQMPRTISGNSKCTAQLECNLNGKCTGVLQSVTQAENPENCQVICQSLRNCTWFTYDSASQTCFALQDCVTLNEDCLTCTSGEAKCPINPRNVRLLTGGGMPVSNIEFDENSYFEALDLESMTQEMPKLCTPIPPTPKSIRGAVGVAAQAQFDLETPMVCGGVQYDDVSNNCWVLYKDSNSWNSSIYEWIEAPGMLKPRAHAASVKVLEAGMTSEWNWWVSGGFDQVRKPLRSSEIRWSNGTWGSGPRLPRAVYGHCVIQISRQKSVLMGGYPTSENYLFDWETQVWSSFPSNTKSRYYHGCAILRNNIEGSEYPYDIVVLGGKSTIDNEILATTEIYKSDLGKWEMGPDFFSPIYGSILVNFDSDTILSIGGATEEGGENTALIGSLSKANLAEWTRFGYTQLSRSAHVAFIVPKASVFCEGDEYFDSIQEDLLTDEELIEEMELQ